MIAAKVALSHHQSCTDALLHSRGDGGAGQYYRHELKVVFNGVQCLLLLSADGKHHLGDHIWCTN